MAIVNGTAGNDLIHVDGDGVIVPPGYTDIAETTSGDDTVRGLGGIDLLVGGAGADLLEGGDGNDVLIGGLGPDTLIGGAGIDTVRYGGTAGVFVILSSGHAFDGDAEGDVISGVEIAEGTGFNDQLHGSTVANTLIGRDGNDTLYGHESGDALYGGSGDDLLDGGDGNDGLTGGDGDDILRGSAGADRLDGGLGADQAEYYFGSVGVTVNLGTGRGAGGDAQGDVISGVENILGTKESGDSLTGSAASNTLDGSGGNDVLSGLGGNDALDGGFDNDILRGGAGADVLNGGAGIDLASYYGVAAAMFVSLTGGPGVGGDAEGDTLVDVENVNGGKAGDSIYGSAAANVLNGYEGADYLYGDVGDDTLFGGAGDDVLRGAAGADRIDGGAGIDTIDYNGVAGVTVNLGTGAGSGGEAEGDVVSGIENIYGTGGYDDALTGSAVANRLEGFTGNDVLSGLGGADRLIGGGGDDVLRGGDGDDVLTVDDGADVLDGGAGRDTFVFATAMVADFAAGVFDAAIAADFWQGFEVIQGSIGNDTVRTGNWDFAMELRGGGGDDVLATGPDTGTADTLSGENGNDQLNGGGGNDVLRGGVGADVLAGSAGIDTASYYSGATGVLVSLASGTGSGGEAQGDTLSGIENLSGSQGGDSLYANAGANVLQGWNGNDILVGRAGKDTLTGGAGADRFQFTVLADSVTGANADRITDFSHAQGDRIDLAAIDARFTVAGDQAFSFIGTAAFSGVAGQLHYWHDAGRTIVSGDVNGNRTADFNIILTGAINLAAGDFVL